MEWCATGRVFGPDEAWLAGWSGRSTSPTTYSRRLRLAGEIATSTSAVSVTLTRALLWRMLGDPTRWLPTGSTPS